MNPTQKSVLLAGLVISTTSPDIRVKPSQDSSIGHSYHAGSLKTVSLSTMPLDDESYIREKLVANKKRLASFKSFKTNWDGNGAIPIKDTVVDKVENLLSSLEYQPMVFPLTGGGIQIEHEITDEYFYEIEVYEDEVNAYIVVGEDEFEGSLSFDSLLSRIRNFENYVFA